MGDEWKSEVTFRCENCDSYTNEILQHMWIEGGQRMALKCGHPECVHLSAFLVETNYFRHRYERRHWQDDQARTFIIPAEHVDDPYETKGNFLRLSKNE